MISVKKQGFTLIELLVVISIISLLSSIVLSALNSARTKASDSQRNSIVGEYVKALALAYDKLGTGQYPQTADALMHCLGDYTPIGNLGSGNCRYDTSGNNLSEDSNVNTKVADYLLSLPALKLVTINSLRAFQGPFYICNSATVCSSPTIEWYLDQPNQKCIKGATPAFIGSGTRCSLILQ